MSPHLGDHDKTKRAKMLLKYVIAEIESVKKCIQCHLNSLKYRYHWFTMVCDEPHLIIWAHMKGYRYWPAKLMSVDEQQVNVRFFGSYHKHDDVSVNKCFLYSKECPSNVKISTNSYKLAIKVSRFCYIKNYYFFQNKEYLLLF